MVAGHLFGAKDAAANAIALEALGSAEKRTDAVRKELAMFTTVKRNYFLLLAHTRPILIDAKIASNHGRMGQRFL